MVRDEDGKILSGSASIIDVEYVKDAKYHSKQVMRERLGKVIYLSEDKKSGIFLSKTRGMVEYDVETNVFKPINTKDDRVKICPQIPEERAHSVFGDTYLMLEFFKKSGLLGVLRTIFTDDSKYEREICHLLHGILRDGSHIGCDDFIEKSFVSYLLENTLASTLSSDTNYFTVLGDDSTRVAFFKTFIKQMRKRHSLFGHGCYVDSTPLPNSISNNPFNALCCHGTGSKQEQIRLILVLDKETGLPVWYDIIPGNVLDLSTTKQILEDVEETLGIDIDELVLDAGYASKELLKAYVGGDMRSVICRMPQKKGYPYQELYQKVKPLIGKAKYSFIRNNHTYFGKKEVTSIFGEEYFTYVFVDQDNALVRAREYILKHQEKYETMTYKEKDWRSVCGGFFVLISTWDEEPSDILNEYFNRTKIENVFKTSKEYLNLLPINKWTDTTVRGKILADVIHTIGYLQLRSAITKTEISTSKIIGRTQSLMCFKGSNGYCIVDIPNKQTKEAFSLLKIPVPAHVNLTEYRKELFNLKM